MPDRCSFTTTDAYCVFGDGHTIGYHHLSDGHNVDSATGTTTVAPVVSGGTPLGQCIREADGPSDAAARPLLTSTQFETAALGAGGRWSGLAEQLDPDQGGLTGSSVIVEDVRPAASAGRSDTNGASPAPGGPGNDLGQLRASDPETELADLVIGVLNARTDIGTTPVPGLKDAEMLGTCSVIELSGDLVAAVLAAGWRPPVTTRVFRYVQPSRDPNVRPVYRAYTDGRITRQTTPEHDELDADADTMGFLEVLVANGGMVEGE